VVSGVVRRARYTGPNGKEAAVDASTMAWLRPLMWVGAIILFIIGGYSDTSTTEMWGWGFALLTGGMLVKHLPAMGKPSS
jgi:hypothetical protein